MILFLYGNDTYRLKERLQFLKEAFQTKYDDAGLNIEELDGAECSIDDFRRATKSVGLFSIKRFIVLRNVWAMPKNVQEAILLEWESIDTNTILCVVTDPPPRKDHFFFQRLLKSHKVERYDEFNASQLRTFIRQKVKEYGATIDAESVELLATNVGNDLWRLHFELKKLTAFTTTIHAEDVQQFVSDPYDENIFHLTDSLSSRNAQRATTLLEQQFALGTNAQYLLAMLGRQIGILYKVKATDGKGLKLHPYVIEQARRQSARFSFQELQQLALRLLDIDRQTKTQTVDPRVLLTMFIVEACHTARSSPQLV